MNPTEQIKALAELDGWKLTQKTIPVWETTQYDGSGEWINKEVALYENDGATKKFERLPNYLTNYDAIIPLIQKQKDNDRLEVGIQLAIMRRKLFGYPTQDNVERWIIVALTATPAQLCEALLRATGKWKE